jgi:TonB family protein
MKQALSLFAFLAVCLVARATDKPIAYDHITKDGAAVDQMVNTGLQTKYDIQPIHDSPAYVDAKYLAGVAPTTVRAASGEILKGYVLIAYVVTADGKADDPVILKSTDERLNAPALNAMADWRFAPAKLNGMPIATTAAQEFNFAPPKSFEVANIALYQPNEVLSQRVPEVQKLADYVKAIEAVLGDHFANDTTPEEFDTVVALRPGKKIGVWFVSSRRPGTGPELDALRQKIEAIDPLDVQGGPLAFAIVARLAGGDPASPPKATHYRPPFPQEWKAAAQAANLGTLSFDDYLNAVWPVK